MPDYSTISSLGHIPTLSWRDTPKISHKLIRWLIGLTTFVGKTITEKLPHGVQNSYDLTIPYWKKQTIMGKRKGLFMISSGDTHTHAPILKSEGHTKRFCTVLFNIFTFIFILGMRVTLHDPCCEQVATIKTPF